MTLDDLELDKEGVAQSLSTTHARTECVHPSESE